MKKWLLLIVALLVALGVAAYVYFSQVRTAKTTTPAFENPFTGQPVGVTSNPFASPTPTVYQNPFGTGESQGYQNPFERLR